MKSSLILPICREIKTDFFPVLLFRRTKKKEENRRKLHRHDALDFLLKIYKNKINEDDDDDGLV